MRLVELDPRFVGAGGEGVFNADNTPATPREGVGLSFLCPCPTCTAKRTGDPDHDFYLRVFVGFSNPLDGGPVFDSGGPKWAREGETFDTLRLSPSILRHKIGEDGCDWHGYVGLTVPGEVTTC